ncbi:hypothetical protein LWI28_028172 [Acer negundo]|uniref:RIN4 pathogenic type III effector avirulence factor Avr cleavage site domain-containing protein n=1 Tax=Acer negundo TaxID=4023 RepID=A0AAD5IWF2_ACENE|nr:hypothetical protein LWI28_028172 [Acer negundo]
MGLICLFVQLQQEAGRPLPKFGEWDVNDPASAEGFTVIFTKARDEKKSNANNNGTRQLSQNQRSQATSKPPENYHHPPMGVCLLIHHFSIKNGSAASEGFVAVNSTGLQICFVHLSHRVTDGNL